MATQGDLAASALTYFLDDHLPQRLHVMIYLEGNPTCHTLGSHSKQRTAWQCSATPMLLAICKRNCSL